MKDEPQKQPFLARWGVALALAAMLLWVLASDLPRYISFLACTVALVVVVIAVQDSVNALVDNVRTTDEHLEFVLRGTKRTVRYEDVMLVCEGGYPILLFSDRREQYESIEYATLYLRRANTMRAWEKICFVLPARLVESGEHPTVARLRQRVSDAKRNAASG